jgi:uncharacterized protein YbjQ (UPF0145 family)
MYTINSFDTTKFIVLGSVVSHHVESISLLRSALADIKGIFGGKASEINKKIQDAISKCLINFEKEIKQKYNNIKSVYSLKIKVSEFGGDSTELESIIDKGKTLENIFDVASYLGFTGGAMNGIYIVVTITGNIIGSK